MPDGRGNLTSESQNDTQVILRRYVHGPGSDEPLVWYEGSGTTDRRWLHADERGSVIAVSDAGGNAIAVNRYDEYGIPASTNMGRFQYTGQAWLPEIGMYYYKARIYSPTLGRFLQTDPIGYADGINWYNYVGSDPVNGVDPTGLNDECHTSGCSVSFGPEIIVTATWTNASSLAMAFSAAGSSGLVIAAALESTELNASSKPPLLLQLRPLRRALFSPGTSNKGHAVSFTESIQATIAQNDVHY